MSRDQLVAAFNEWQRRFTENSDDFGFPEDPLSYGEACADYLLELLKELGE